MLMVVDIGASSADGHASRTSLGINMEARDTLLTHLATWQPQILALQTSILDFYCTATRLAVQCLLAVCGRYLSQSTSSLTLWGTMAQTEDVEYRWTGTGR